MDVEVNSPDETEDEILHHMSCTTLKTIQMRRY